MIAETESLKLYLREIGMIPRLTPKQEYALGTTIHELGLIDERTEEQEADYQDAIQRMVEANLRLVVSIAKRYTQYAPLDICISGGNIGLIRGTPNYNPAKGTRFSTYITIWIRQQILLDLNERRLIQLPLHMITRMRVIRELSNVFMRNNGREPTEEELLIALNAWLRRRYIDKHKAEPTEDELLAYARNKNLNLTAKDIYEIRYLPTTIPLDAPVNESGGSIADTIESAPPEQPAPDHTQMYLILMSLPAETRKMLKLRLGLLDGQNWTLLDVGREFKKTRERVRQQEKEGLETLSEKFGTDLNNLLGDDE